MKKQSLNALAASYRADLLYYIERAKLGKCPPHWQAYCFGEIAAAKARMPTLRTATHCWTSCTGWWTPCPRSRTARKARRRSPPTAGQMLFYFDRDYYTLAELVRLPDRKKYGAAFTLTLTAAGRTARAMPMT